MFSIHRKQKHFDGICTSKSKKGPKDSTEQYQTDQADDHQVIIALYFRERKM
jgi:hypothetical protein